MSQSPSVTVYFLGASRAIRVPWLLEELGVPYDLVVAPRNKAGVAPQDFKDKIPAPLKKSPTIKDGDLVVQESGAILEYLLEKYDTKSALLPPKSNPADRYKAYEWLHAAEGTFMLHALAILYARWKLPEAAQSSLPEMESSLSGNVQNDLRWLEGALSAQHQKSHEYLVGDSLTVADVMMAFSIEFIFARGLGTKQGGEGWPEIQRWLGTCLGREGYKRAVERSGYTLDSKGEFRT